MGDLGRHLPDGSIEILGRKDDQIKVRGIRVEPTGIEATLKTLEGIEDCTVLGEDRASGDKRLVAYVVSRGKAPDQIRRELADIVPSYMVPSRIVPVECLPRQPNGKVDRRALRTLADGAPAKVERPWRPVAEHRAFVTACVARIFEIPAAEIEDTVPFLEMGADSVMLVELIQAINRHYGLELGIATLFSHSSIRDLANFLAAQIEMPAEPVAALAEPRPASPKAASRRPADQEIAVIGMSGRFPQADTLAEFWSLLQSGREAIGEIPRERWDGDAYYDPDPSAPGKSVSKWGGFIKGIDAFDPLFFSISPHEAERMDPQQRLCLEECWKAFEDAGYSRKDLASKPVGVFIGVRAGDYRERLDAGGIEPDAYTMIGNDSAILASRISYLLDLTGPAMSIDTACSSALVAVHLACQSIRCGESEFAIAGGVNLMTTARSHVTDSKAGMLSPVGRCRTFDNAADGFVHGEGVGVVVLKPLHRALEDGDAIYGVIRGTGINQDGRSNGITAPNARSQIELVESVYRKYEVDPSTISYVEAHGTGTKLGDPIEVDSLSRVFRKWTSDRGYCAIGSVKTNIGHTVAAAGIAGLIKVLLSMKYQSIPASLNCEEENEHIDFEQSPFYVNKSLRHWSSRAGVRRAAISSFGFSGTNAHIVVDAFEARLPAIGDSTSLILLSARNSDELRDVAKQLAEVLRAGTGYRLSDIAYTLQVGRMAMDARLAIVVSSIPELIEKLAHFENGDTDTSQAVEGQVKSRDDLSNLILHGRAGEAFMRAVLEDRDLPRLGALWVCGCDIDWHLLYGENRPRRVSLPTYPFARNSYWPASSGPEEPKPAGQAEDLNYLIEWKEQSIASQPIRQHQRALLVSCGPAS